MGDQRVSPSELVKKPKDSTAIQCLIDVTIQERFRHQPTDRTDQINIRQEDCESASDRDKDAFKEQASERDRKVYL
jgi:hypothetical protein